MGTDYLDLPQERCVNHFPDFLFSKLLNYLKWIENSDGLLPLDAKPLLPIIERLTRFINESIEAYYCGSQIESYKILEKGLNGIKNYLISEIRPQYDTSEAFYRIRQGNTNTYSKEQMFHVPFDLREYSNQGRYSLAGNPCLYIADSVYTCWLELNKPSIEQCQISKIELPKNNYKFIDFSWYPRRFIKYVAANIATSQSTSDIAYYHKRLESFLVTWPLQFTSSIRTKYSDAPFKPEYIIPQFIMQWIKDHNEVDGIKYFSSKLSSMEPEINSTYTNIAIPVKSSKKDGHCEILKEKYILTEPINMKLLFNNEPNFERSYTPKDAMYWLNKHGTAIGKIDNGMAQKSYSETLYGLIETKLSKMEASKLL